MIYRFLFDECLSPDLAQLAHSLGFEAFHVRDLHRLGSSDPSLALLAIERNYVFVTNNRIDFTQIYRKLELHPGLVIILPSTGVPLHRNACSQPLSRHFPALAISQTC